MPAVLLTPEALAARWGIKSASLKARRRRREGPPFVAVGNNIVRYRLSDIERWERERRVEHRTPAKTGTR